MIDYEARRWSLHLVNFRGSVAPQILWRVGVHVIWSTAIVAFDHYVQPVGIQSTVHTLIGVALGLLLVFRTNASYERFWEGRKAWGNIVNETRNLVRASRAFLAADPALVESITLWAAAFPYACMHTLRGEADVGPVATRLPPGDVREVLAAPHVPSAVATRVSRLLSDARPSGVISDRMAIAIDANVVILIDNIGTCERIQKTPLPFAYVVHLRQALMLYCASLPFALVGNYGWSTIVYTLLVTYVLLGIEAIGVEIENPFGTDPNDLPLENICAMLERELLDDPVRSGQVERVRIA